VLQVRRLTGKDAAAFQALRLKGLREHPDAFGSSFEEEVDRSLNQIAEALDARFVAGCEREGVLVGIGGIRRGDSVKTRHRAVIWGMYVDPEARGLGAGALLLSSLIDHARGRVEDVTLTVAAHNEAAVRLYGRFGFIAYGLDPGALKLGNDYIDERLMRLVLAP
jgi:ribosomal protein S18 acetylase RimI-like enzyme